MKNWSIKNRISWPPNWKFIFHPGPRLGDVVVEAKGISKAFGDNVLYENVEFSLPKGGIVGVIGPNGAAKRPCSA